MQNTLIQVDDDPNPKMPGAVILATFDSHDDARRAAARMIENKFPPSQIVLVGFGFYMLERVRSSNHDGKAAREIAQLHMWACAQVHVCTPAPAEGDRA